ncbi:MAG: HAD family hydrolase [Gemmatimonadota bacterium]
MADGRACGTPGRSGRGATRAEPDPPVRAVVFDFGGVVSDFDVGIFLRRIAPRAGKTADEIGSLIYGSGLPVLYESGRISSAEFFSRLAALCGLRMSEAEFVTAFTEIFTPIEPTLDLIRRLKGRTRLGLLSNTNEWHFRGHIATLSVFPLFDAVTLSYEVGTMKPGERIYRDVLDKLGLPPEACVFIDDIAENVAAARKLSMRAILYEGHDRLVEALAELSVTA